MRLLTTSVGLLALVLSLACSTRALPERQDQPGEAAEYDAAKRAGADDPQARYEDARRIMWRMGRNSVGDTGASRALSASSDGAPIATWSFLGPGNIGGRTRVLLIDPAQPETMYAAAVSGGIWKTTNGGAVWTAAGDLLANLAVNSMAMNPHDSQVVYAGTGEGYFREEVRGTGLPLRGAGIFVTRDGAHSWTRLPSTANDDFAWVNDLVISENDPQRIYAATRTGIWRSADAGDHWERVLATSVKGGCLDLAARFDGGHDLLLASCGTLDQATVYRNADAGGSGSWDGVLSEAAMGRTSLAFSPSNPSIVYALSASNEPGTNDQGLFAVFRSDKGGAAGSWTTQIRGGAQAQRPASLLLTNPASASNSICSPVSGVDQYVTMGWYCNTIAVDPRDPNIVWAAGVDLFRSNDGGRTWGVASYWWASQNEPTFLHADQHSIVFHPQYDGVTNQTMFGTNDGGVYRTDNSRAAVAMAADGVCVPTRSKVKFSSLNHAYGATQFYHGLPFPDGRHYLGGAQDNGTVLGGAEPRIDGWSMIYGGDGAYVAIDPQDSATFYVSSQGANIVKTHDGGKTFSSVRLGLNDSFLFITPYIIDPNNRLRLWTGGRQLWKTEDGAALWKAASTQLDGRVSALAVAPGNADLVLAGTTAGDIVRNDRATQATSTTAWARVRPRDGWVSSIAFGDGAVYTTYAGFGGAHVWRSTDEGQSWTPIEGSGTDALPDIPVHSIAPDPTRPGRLFLGTDLGVFTSNDGGATWRVENTGFANVVTEWVTIGQGAQGSAVYAFTHGRGLWRAELTAPTRRRSAR